MRNSLFLIAALGAVSILISSCCTPASKDSQPVLVDSLFSRSTFWDIDINATADNAPGAKPDSGYYPVYTFGVYNSGSQDDLFTLRVRSQYTLTSGTPLGFDISRMVPAHSTVLFRTPTAIPDTITSLERITYPHLTDTLPLMSYAYYGFFASTPDSTTLGDERATVSVLYGAIDNGAEGCNTPATQKVLNISHIANK